MSLATRLTLFTVVALFGLVGASGDSTCEAGGCDLPNWNACNSQCQATEAACTSDCQSRCSAEPWLPECASHPNGGTYCTQNCALELYQCYLMCNYLWCDM
jgi:hypothetical protein